MSENNILNEIDTLYKQINAFNENFGNNFLQTLNDVMNLSLIVNKSLILMKETYGKINKYEEQYTNKYNKEIESLKREIKELKQIINKQNNTEVHKTQNNNKKESNDNKQK